MSRSAAQALPPSPAARPPARGGAEGALAAALAEVERHVAAMTQALVAQDPAAAEHVGVELREALRAAMPHLARAQHAGGLPAPLRRRLALVRGQINAQREGLARATAALDGALDILLPKVDGPGIYSAAGVGTRPTGRVIAAS